MAGLREPAYRRIGQADTLEALSRVEADLASAYGDPPAQTRALLEAAEIRLRAATLGIRAIARTDSDVIFRTTRPRDLELLFAGIQGTVRVVGGPAEDGLTEVYLRPPTKAFLEPASLVPILRKRLAV